MTRKHAWGTALYYLVTLLIAMVPFVWMISTSLKTRGALMSIPIEWVPEHPTLDAYQTVFERFPFFQTILNSLFISVSYTVLTLLSASLAAYAFTKIRFRGSGLVLGLYLATMRTIPGDYLDAAKIDGASTFRIYRSVMLPLCVPTLATLSITTFMESWNDYL